MPANVTERAPAPKKVLIRTYGCQMNEYDSSRIADLLAGRGLFSRTDSLEEADLVVINTCSIREKAQDKVFSDLGRLRIAKRERPALRIAVGGCVASQEGEAIVRRAPFVDVVFGPQTLHRLPALLAERERSGKPQVDIAFPFIEKFDALPPPRVEGPTAFVSVMEGCSKYCSYCVVPYTRGVELSRPLESVVEELAELACQGVREVTLLGQNVNAYQGRAPNGTQADFAELLACASEVPGIERIRFMTSHPQHFGARLIEAFRTLPKLASHVHLPVQSGSDRILAAMKRGYTALEYRAIVRRLRQARPGISVTSDFIVGFPGETERDFGETMRLIEDMRFDASFSFVYSPRPGTPAAALEDPVPQSVKLERLRRLQALNNAHAEDFARALVGGVERVLVTGEARRGGGLLAARTDTNHVVNFLGGPELVGRMCRVRVTEANPHTLGGILLETE